MQSILASLDSCNQASLFCTIQLPEQISPNQPIDILKKRIKGGKPQNSTMEGGIDLPPDEFYQVHTLSSRHPPSPRPGNSSRPSFRPQSQNPGPMKPIRRYDGPIFLPPQIYKLLSQDAMKALKAYTTEAINRFHQRKVHKTDIGESPQNDLPEASVPKNDPPDLTESHLMIPFSTLGTVSVTALRISTRLFRLTWHTRYHAVRIPT